MRVPEEADLALISVDRHSASLSTNRFCFMSLLKRKGKVTVDGKLQLFSVWVIKMLKVNALVA